MADLDRWLSKPLPWILFVTAVWTVASYNEVLGNLFQNPFSMTGDDDRHFVTWLRQLSDSGLFPDDPIANYFSQLTPLTYKALFLPGAVLGLDPVVWKHLAVIPLFSVLTTVAVYWFFQVLLRNPIFAGFATVGLLCVWTPMEGLPRSIGLAIFLIPLCAYLEGRRYSLLVAMFLGASMYPASAMASGGAIVAHAALTSIQGARLRGEALKLVLLAGAAGIAGLALFSYGISDLGPAITRAQALPQALFWPGGRAEFFSESSLRHVLCGRRSGFLVTCFSTDVPWSYALSLVLNIGIVFIGLICASVLKGGKASIIDGSISLIWASITISGIFFFFMSHLMLFRLHLPQRYSMYTFEFIFYSSLSLLLVVLLNIIGNYLKYKSKIPKIFGYIALSGFFFGIAVALYYKASLQLYADEEPHIAEFLKSQPKDVTVAGFSAYADNIPAYSSRSTFVSRELLVPYKHDYFKLIERRVGDLGIVFRDPHSQQAKSVLHSGQIDFLLLTLDGGDTRGWSRSFPGLVPQGRDVKLRSDLAPFSSCVAVQGRRHVLVDVRCVLASPDYRLTAVGPHITRRSVESVAAGGDRRKTSLGFSQPANV